MTMKPNGYWTFERCKEEALKYSTRIEFSDNSRLVYSASRRKGWLDKICSHMNPILESWSEEKILKDIKEYKSIAEIKKNNSKLHSAIYRFKLSNKVHEILGRTGNRFHKCIYSYEFPDNSVYVGLTYNIEKRQKSRDNKPNDSVTKHIRETNLSPIRKQLTDYIDVNEAIKLEEFYVSKYKNEGWIILNQVATGAIGGNVVKWTFETCTEEALKYNTKIDFRNNSSSAYVTAKNKKWLNDICKHMIEIKKPNGYWTKEKCVEISMLFDNLTDLAKEYPSCWVIMKRNGWLDELTKHMSPYKRKPPKYWNFERSKEMALLCSTRQEFREKYESAYDAARKHGFLDEICAHMKPLRKKRI